MKRRQSLVSRATAVLLFAVVSGASAESYSVSIDFDSEALGAVSGDFERVTISAAAFSGTRTDCTDLRAWGSGLALTPGGSNSACASRSGVEIVDESRRSRNGKLALQFDVSTPPDLVEFEVHQDFFGSTAGGIEPVEVVAFNSAGDAVFGALQDDVGVASFSISNPVGIARVEIECGDGFTLDNLAFSRTERLLVECDGFLPPILDDQILVRGNRTVPFKIRILDAQGAVVSISDLDQPPVLSVVGGSLDFRPTDDGKWVAKAKARDFPVGVSEAVALAGSPSYVLSSTCVAEVTRE